MLLLMLLLMMMMTMMMTMGERKRREWGGEGREGVWREEQVGDGGRERKGSGNEVLGIAKQADEERAVKKVSIG